MCASAYGSQEAGFRSRVFEIQQQSSGAEARTRWDGRADLMPKCSGHGRNWIRANAALDVVVLTS